MQSRPAGLGDEHGAGSQAQAAAMPTRYRCTSCGNLTRFDVLERRRTRSFYHYSLGGLLRVEDEEVLERDVEEVRCRWCGSVDVDEVEALEAPGED